MLLRGLALLAGLVTITRDHPLSRYNEDAPFKVRGKKFKSVDAYMQYKRGAADEPPAHWRDLCEGHLQDAYATKYEQSAAFRRALRATKVSRLREHRKDDTTSEACPGDQQRWIVGRLLESFRETPPNQAESTEV